MYDSIFFLLIPISCDIASYFRRFHVLRTTYCKTFSNAGSSCLFNQKAISFSTNLVKIFPSSVILSSCLFAKITAGYHHRVQNSFHKLANCSCKLCEISILLGKLSHLLSTNSLKLKG